MDSIMALNSTIKLLHKDYDTTQRLLKVTYFPKARAVLLANLQKNIFMQSSTLQTQQLLFRQSKLQAILLLSTKEDFKISKTYSVPDLALEDKTDQQKYIVKEQKIKKQITDLQTLYFSEKMDFLDLFSNQWLKNYFLQIIKNQNFNFKKQISFECNSSTLCGDLNRSKSCQSILVDSRT